MTPSVQGVGAGPALDHCMGLIQPALRPTSPVVRNGYLDLIGAQAPPSTGRTQDLMLTSLVPTIYERWWRPGLGRIAKGLFGPGMEDEQVIARRMLSMSADDRVLDIACGTGNFSRSFARAVGSDGLVIGVDVSETMLARAVTDTRAARLDGVLAYVRASVLELPFEPGSFDGVCCFAALHLFEDPFAALERMLATLRPGGRIAIFTSVRSRFAPLRPLDGLIAPVSGMKMFEPDEITTALEQRGCGAIEQRIAGLTQFVGGRLGQS